jgi:ADP-heptose:LPS heptosyltransferase
MPTDYWHDPAFGQPGERAFQILASMFGLRRPVDEKLWVPWSLDQNDPVLHACLPWKKKNILLCPTSESPRKQMAFERWEAIVDRLRCDDFLVVQLGRRNDPHVRGTYSLLGLTTTRQAITLMRRFDLVLGVDNFLMHAAHLCEVPAVILWGPTDHRVYGYAGHVHMQAPACANLKDCIAPHNSHVYATECPKGPAHCMDQLALDSIYQAAREVLTGSRCSAPSPPPG